MSYKIEICKSEGKDEELTTWTKALSEEDIVPFPMPSFEIKEPNISSQRKRNEEGFCAIYKCHNRIDYNDDFRYYGGFILCEKHKKEVIEKLEKSNIQFIEGCDAELLRMIELAQEKEDDQQKEIPTHISPALESKSPE
jgi:hypothetical protein